MNTHRNWNLNKKENNFYEKLKLQIILESLELEHYKVWVVIIGKKFAQN